MRNNLYYHKSFSKYGFVLFLLGLSFVLSWPLLLLAQKPQFQYYTTDDGLVTNRTIGTTQDDQGFIWFINNGHLLRFDGRTFFAYPPPPTNLAGTEEVFSGMISYQDSLLLIKGDQHLFLLNPKTEDWKSFKISIQEGQNKFIWSIQSIHKNKAQVLVLEGEKDKIWEVWYFENQALIQKVAPKMNDVSFPPGYLATVNNQSLFPVIDSLINNNTVAIFSDKHQLKDLKAQYYQILPNGDVAILTNNYGFGYPVLNQLFILNPVTKKLTPHPINRFLQNYGFNPYDFLMAENGDCWIVGENKKLYFYQANRDMFYDFQPELEAIIPTTNDLLELFQDRMGIIWIGTRGGLLRITPNKLAIDTYYANKQAACFGHCSFRGIAEDAKGNIYGGSYGATTWKIDPEKKQELGNLKFNMSFDLMREGDYLLQNTVHRINTQKDELETYATTPNLSNFEHGIFAKDAQGKIWFLFQNELFYLDPKKTPWQWSLAVNLPHIIHSEALHFGQYSGLLWMENGSQLFQYETATKKLTTYPTTEWGLRKLRILHVEEAPDKKLWLATNHGLIQFDPVTKERQQWNVEEGLAHPFVCGLLTEGDSCLWLSTHEGLSRFHVPTQSFTNFLEEDGLTDNKFNRMAYYKARNGRFFFGGYHGINAFFPAELMQSIQSNKTNAQMVLSAIEYVDEQRDTFIRKTIFNRPGFEFYHYNKSYTFEYALTDFKNPESLQYSYFMEGYDKTWSIPSPYNFTRFTRLPVGKYTFRVRAKDSKGFWYPHQLSIPITVFPPWWSTWWAYAIYALLFAGLLWAGYWFIRRRWLLQQELVLKQQESQRLKDLDQFKSKLYTNLTHEFRTPLTVILGMVGQMRAAPDQYFDKGTQLIETNGKNLLRLINQLLDLSKMDHQAFYLNWQNGDILPYLRYLTESFQTYANSNNLSLRFYTTLSACQMDYDAEQIKQVVTNLISNAIKFTPSGGAISLHVQHAANQLQIQVKDNGIGISKADLPNIFDRFYQIDDSTTRKGEGTGIGLAHTRELVKLMQGSISVDSQKTPHSGTCFTILLPITNEAPTTVDTTVWSAENTLTPTEVPITSPDLVTAVKATASLGNGKPTSKKEQAQLLLIEDNPDVVAYLKICLEAEYQLDIAFNGKIGVEKALETIPDLIISDVMMPEKDGYEVCNTLKNDERTSHIPIILLTAKADAASKMVGLKRGADAYLSKPFDKEELMVRLAMLFTRQQKLVNYFSKKFQAEVVSEVAETAQLLPENAFLNKISQIVEKHLSETNFSVHDLCHKMGYSQSQLYRKIKALTNQSPAMFIRHIRLLKARDLLSQGDLNVSEVCYAVGFSDPSYFSKIFSETFGVAPSQY